MNIISKLLFFCILFGATQIQAKNRKIKFGRVEPEDVKMLVYEPDTSASAVVLYDGGNTYFVKEKYNYSTKFIYERIQRIKILKKEGLHYADFNIIVLDPAEKVSGIKGFTYNLVDGEVVKTKLQFDSKNIEHTADNINTFKIIFPNVKQGSVVELKYTITSYLIGSLRGWNFQWEIPVRFSEYEVSVPEYIKYHIQMKGYEELNESGQKRTTFNRNQSVNYYWNAKEMPSFKEEPFMLNKKGFITGVNFEISEINIPGYVYNDISNTWESILSEMNESFKLGKVLNTGSFLNDEVKNINSGSKDEKSKVYAALNFVRNNVKWNNILSINTFSPLKKVFNNGEGNVAEINLMLTVLLQKLNIDCEPVVIGTRSLGIINSYFPKMSAFNYLIVAARINGEEFLLDATDEVTSISDLPFRCFNGKGLKLKPSSVEWVDLCNKKANKKVNVTIDLSDPDKTTGTISCVYGDYEAYLYRKNIQDKTRGKIIEEFEAENEMIRVNEFVLKSVDELDEPVQLTYDVDFSNISESGADYMYINPIVFLRHKSNPFTLEDRMFPVDFGYSQSEELITTIIPPEGFSIESLPTSEKVTLPMNSGTFIYVTKEHNNTIQILSRIQLNKPIYSFNEYADLKEFYNKIVSKQSEMILLKKNS